MAKYRKTAIVDAMQWNGRNEREIREFAAGARIRLLNALPGVAPAHLIIHTLEGDMRADVNDYIIRGPFNEFYPCKPEIFAQTYEAAGEL